MLRIRNRQKDHQVLRRLFIFVLAITIGETAKKIGEKQVKPEKRYINWMFFTFYLH